jgi:hypothetical protein
VTTRDEQFRNLYLDLRIDDQAGFYADRSAEYKNAHQQAVYLRNGLITLAGLLGVIGQIPSGTARAALGVVAAVLAALAGAVAAYDALLDFPKLQKLYGDVSLSVAEIRIDWVDPSADARLGAEMGRAERIFATEQGQWGQLVLKSGSEAADDQAEGGDQAGGNADAGHDDAAHGDG